MKTLSLVTLMMCVSLWATADAFVAKICFIETPFVVTVRLQTADQQIRVVSKSNVGFGATKETPLVGTLEK